MQLGDGHFIILNDTVVTFDELFDSCLDCVYSVESIGCRSFFFLKSCDGHLPLAD